MPTIHQEAGFNFGFNDKDITSNEPPHIHIKRKRGSRDRGKI